MKKKKEEGNRNEDGEREGEAKREREMEYKRGKERWSLRERKKDGIRGGKKRRNIRREEEKQ